jgi:Lar family restriction alleviation protein
MTITIEGAPLRQCPFCNSEDAVIDWESYAYGKSGYFYVYCEGCLARGPEKKSQAEAIEDWNSAPRREVK